MYAHSPAMMTAPDIKILAINGTFVPPIADTADIANIVRTGVISTHQIIDRIVLITDNSTTILYSYDLIKKRGQTPPKHYRPLFARSRTSSNVLKFITLPQSYIGTNRFTT